MRTSNYWIIGLFLCGLAVVGGCKAHERYVGKPGAVAEHFGISLGEKRTVPQEILDQAKTVGHEVVCLCPTCNRRYVDECDCGWARRNQLTIQYALMDGKTPDEIVQAYIDVHGLRALPRPPATPLGNLSWALPYGLTLFSLLLLAWYGLRLRTTKTPELVRVGPQGPQTKGSEDEQLARRRLARELDELEDEY